MWINREISEILVQFSQSFPAVVLVGARQSGKSSLASHTFPNYTYVSLDIPTIAEMAETTPEEFLNLYKPPVIIDEIQYAPELFRYLKSYIDKHRQDYGSFILTGSQKFELMQSVSESLAGRCGILNLSTLSSSEILASTPTLSQNQIILRGGYPELYARAELNKNFFYQSYIATYLERDVRSLLKVNSLRDFQRFITALALRTGQILNKTDLARDISISASTASEWLSLLVVSNQITLLEPYFSNGLKSLIKSPKIYFNDTGLLLALLNISTEEQLLTSPLIGSIWENFVFSELRKMQYNRTANFNLYFWRDRYGLEVDFIIPEGGRFTLLEAKWHEHPEISHLRNLEKLSEQLGKENIKSIKVICRSQVPYKIATQDLTIQVQGIPIKSFDPVL